MKSLVGNYKNLNYKDFFYKNHPRRECIQQHYAYPFQGEFIIGKNTRFLNAFALRLPVVNRPRLRREIAAYQVNRSVVCSILTGISFFLDLFQGFSC